MSSQDELMRKREQWLSEEEKEKLKKEKNAKDRLKKDKIAKEQELNAQEDEAVVHEKDVKSIVTDADKVREIVSRYGCEMKGIIFAGNDIPKKKLDNARLNYAYIKSTDAPLLLLDTSIWDNGKSGIVMTEQTLYFKDDLNKPDSINLCDIMSVKLDGEIKKGAVPSLLINDVEIIKFISLEENKTAIEAFISTIQDIIDQIYANKENGSPKKVLKRAKTDWRALGKSYFILFSIVLLTTIAILYMFNSGILTPYSTGQLVGGLVGVIVMFSINPFLGLLTLLGLIAYLSNNS